MSIDLAALLSLQKRRTQRAIEALAAAEAVRRNAEAKVQALTRARQDLQASHTTKRSERIRGILQEPASVVSLSRIKLQYDIGEEEIETLSQDIRHARENVAEAARKVEAAKAIADACMKREKKLEEAAGRIGQGLARIQDVQAEMELER